MLKRFASVSENLPPLKWRKRAFVHLRNKTGTSQDKFSCHELFFLRVSCHVEVTQATF